MVIGVRLFDLMLSSTIAGPESAVTCTSILTAAGGSPS
ncbi:hypothetical protein APASM_1585 [Actinosynnema pretiosum subsp. pretiosum]|nr:hypothetical protein APASM_1585 [Actinosynnema pretiosum subsp. pretiosum]